MPALAVMRTVASPKLVLRFDMYAVVHSMMTATSIHSTTATRLLPPDDAAMTELFMAAAKPCSQKVGAIERGIEETRGMMANTRDGGMAGWRDGGMEAVSYTHLTLPTIYSV